MRRLADLLHRRSGVAFLMVRQMAHDVFNHHNRAIHHHAEIERPQRQQVGGDAFELKAGGREQQREGNRQSDDNRSPHIPQKQEENNHHQNDALPQIVENRMGGVMHQIAAVEKGNHRYAVRKYAMVQLVHLRVDTFQHRVRIGAFAEENDIRCFPVEGVESKDIGGLSIDTRRLT